MEESTELHRIEIKRELVTYHNGRLGMAIAILTDSPTSRTPVKYVVMSFENNDEIYQLWANEVKIIPNEEKPKLLKLHKSKQRAEQPKKEVPKKKEVKDRPPAPVGEDLMVYLAKADVGVHDTALGYAAALVRHARMEHAIDFSGDENLAILYKQFRVWADRYGKSVEGITMDNLLARIEGELFYITEEKKLKHAPYVEPRDESRVIEAGHKKQRKVKDASAVTPKPLAEEQWGKYAYHTTSFINLYLIAGRGLSRNRGGTPGGSCYLAEGVDQRDNSIQHSKQVIAAALGRHALNTYVNQRENKADMVFGDDELARSAQDSEMQSDLDERGVLLRFKILPEHEWVTDPQDARALLLGSHDVPPDQLECLTDEGWVGVEGLHGLQEALNYDNTDVGAEFQAFVRQIERVLWRLKHEPADNDILEGRAFLDRGLALLDKVVADSGAHVQLQMIISDLTDTLERMREPARAQEKTDKTEKS